MLYLNASPLSGNKMYSLPMYLPPVTGKKKFALNQSWMVLGFFQMKYLIYFGSMYNISVYSLSELLNNFHLFKRKI